MRRHEHRRVRAAANLMAASARVGVAWLCCVPLCAGAADGAVDADAGAGAAEYKLTLGRYHLASVNNANNAGNAVPSSDGTDLNLRWRRDGRTLWLGLYQQPGFGRQWRVGWDDQWPLAPGAVLPLWWPASLSLQLLPSLQAASGGFVGGSLGVQAGAPFYAQVGIGRTNLKPYANLNFDPNDAITLALGWQGEGSRQIALSVIADDRLGTGQQHHHLTLRWPLPPGWRLSADLLHKQGQGDAGPVNAWGWSLGLDGAAWFARLARDPKQNFSAQDAWRVSGGRRF